MLAHREGRYWYIKGIAHELIWENGVPVLCIIWP